MTGPAFFTCSWGAQVLTTWLHPRHPITRPVQTGIKALTAPHSDWRTSKARIAVNRGGTRHPSEVRHASSKFIWSKRRTSTVRWEFAASMSSLCLISAENQKENRLFPDKGRPCSVGRTPVCHRQPPVELCWQWQQHDCSQIILKTPTGSTVSESKGVNHWSITIRMSFTQMCKVGQMNHALNVSAPLQWIQSKAAVTDKGIYAVDV